MSDHSSLKKQVIKTIQLLVEEFGDSDEPIVKAFITKYQRALKSLENKDDHNVLLNNLRALLNCSRAYLETSSGYQQAFLNEMAATEQLVKFWLINE